MTDSAWKKAARELARTEGISYPEARRRTAPPHPAALRVAVGTHGPRRRPFHLNLHVQHHVFITGRTGFGKSHLMKIIADDMRIQNPDVEVWTVTGDTWGSLDGVGQQIEIGDFSEVFARHYHDCRGGVRASAHKRVVVLADQPLGDTAKTLGVLDWAVRMGRGIGLHCVVAAQTDLAGALHGLGPGALANFACRVDVHEQDGSAVCTLYPDHQQREFVVSAVASR